MDIKLREIAGNKPAGVYFIVNDNSQVGTIATVSKKRLMFISSERGPVNTVVEFESGDIDSFKSVFGSSTRQMEKRGNYSLKAAVEALEGGALSVMNLRVFDDKLDKLGIRGFGASTAKGETGDAPYTSVFNTNTLWTVTPKYIPNQLTQSHLINIANVGNSDISVFFVVASEAHVAEQTSEGDETIRNSQLVIDDYPALDPDKLIKDTFVDVYVFANTFEPSTVGTNKYYGQFFDENGNVDLTRLEELSEVPEAGFVRRFTGSLIPNLKSEMDVNISIDSVINQSYAETGLVCFINDDVLEVDDYNVIDFDGGSFYDEEGNFIQGSSETMLSHVVPQKVSKTLVKYPPLSDELHVITDQEVIYETEKISDTEFISAFEQGIRVGDKIKGLDGNMVEVTGIEIVEEDVPAVDPQPEQNYMVTIQTPENGSIIVMNGNEVVESGTSLPENTVLQLSATPNKDYELVDFVVNSQSLLGSSQIVVNSETTITANFRKIQYQVTFNQPQNGTVTVSDSMGEITSGDTVDKGSEITISVNPNEGYELDKIVVNDIELSPGTYSGIVNSNTVIEVYLKLVQYRVSIEPLVNGKVVLKNHNGEVVENNSLQNYGELISLEITPDKYFQFKSASVNEEPIIDNSFTVKTTSLIKVSFVALQSTINFATPSNGQLIIRDPENHQLTTGQKVNQGTVLTINAIPAQNYQVDRIEVNGVVLEKGVNTFVVEQDTSVSVYFKIIKRTVTKVASQHGSFTISDAGGESIVSGEQVNQGSSIKVEAMPDAHYKLDKIYVNEVALEEGSISGNVGTIVVPAEDIVIRVSFKQILHNVTVNPTENVTTKLFVKGQKVSGQIGEGETVSVVCEPAFGYEVTQISVNDSPIEGNTFIVEGETTVSVTVALKQYTVSFNQSPENGTFEVYKKDAVLDSETKLNSGDKVKHGTEIIVKPTAAQYYKVLNVLINDQIQEIGEDGNVTLTLTNDIFVNVLFIMKRFTLSLKGAVNNGSVVVKDSKEMEVVLPGEVLAYPAYKIITTPNAHYRLKTLTINDVPVEDPNNVLFTENSVLNVEFELIKWTVTVNETQNGSVKISANGLQVDYGTQVTDGDVITITPTANQYYELDKIVVNDGIDHELGKDEFTFEVLNNVTVKVTFKNKPATLSLDSTGYNAGDFKVKTSETGNSDWTDYSVNTFQNYKVAVTWPTTEDFEITFNAEGVAIEEADPSALDPDYTGKMFTIVSDMGATLSSKRLFNIIKNPTENGSFEVKKDGSPVSGKVKEGDQITIKATPAENYEVDKITANDEEITSPYTIPTWTNHEITEYKIGVSFKPIMRNVTIGTISDENGNSITVKNGGSPLSDTTQIAQGTSLTIEKTLSPGWVVENITVNEEPKGDIASVTVDKDITITASFKREQYRIDFTSPTTGGSFTITKVGDGGTVNNGDSVDSGTQLQVNATPDENYSLGQISVNGEPIEEGNTFTPTKNSTVTVEFPIKKSTVTFTPETLQVNEQTYNIKLFSGDEPTIETPVTSGTQVDFGKVLKIEMKTEEGEEIGPESVSISLVKDDGEPEDYVYGTSYIPVKNAKIDITISQKA